MRLLTMMALLAPLWLLAGEVPEPMRKALESFQIEGTKSWSYVQTTKAEGRCLVERFDPSKPELLRWELVSDDGKAPSAERTESYRQAKLRRSSAWNAPRIEKQLDLGTCEQLPGKQDFLRCRFRLLQTDPRDNAAKHMAVSIRLHLPTATIDEVEIANHEPFSPSFGITIRSSRTLLRYSLPEKDRPSFLLQATLEIQGRAFWIKGISQAMDITWTEHSDRSRAQRARHQENPGK